MSPLNRRGFLTRCAGVALAALALKPSVPDAIKWKSRLWFTSGRRAPIEFSKVADPDTFDVDPVRNVDTGRTYATLQSAMADAKTGQTLILRSGVVT